MPLPEANEGRLRGAPHHLRLRRGPLRSHIHNERALLSGLKPRKSFNPRPFLGPIYLKWRRPLVGVSCRHFLHARRRPPSSHSGHNRSSNYSSRNRSRNRSSRSLSARRQEQFKSPSLRRNQNPPLSLKQRAVASQVQR